MSDVKALLRSLEDQKVESLRAIWRDQLKEEPLIFPRKSGRG